MAATRLQRLSGGDGARHWSSKVKQVTKSNFSLALHEIKACIDASDFIAIASQKTGAFSSPWRRPLSFDTSEVAYRKAKDAAEKFQLLQFAICPFKIQGSKVIAYPYNFHLFPRDELNMGMPSYNFSCQTSLLESMARHGFDFNICIYDGISYLSRVQECKAKNWVRDPIPSICSVTSSSSPSVADAIFMERVKSRVQHWRNSCKDSNKITDDALISSLRKIMLGSEVYGSRQCINVDVCNDRQVQLVVEVPLVGLHSLSLKVPQIHVVCMVILAAGLLDLHQILLDLQIPQSIRVLQSIGRAGFKMLSSFSDDLVPLLIPNKDGQPKTVRVVLTSSEEDKSLLKSELQNLEEEQYRQIRGFREVIDTMSNSHKPIVAYSCLSDFTFIHSKFIAPLPPSLAEFTCSLKLVFSNVIDINHLWKEVGPLNKANNLSAASAYLNRQFFVPIDMEIPHQAQENQGKNHGHNVVRITHLFAKLASILKLIHTDCQAVVGDHTIENYSNIFIPSSTSLEEPIDENEVPVCNVKRACANDLVFLWGFKSGTSAGKLKRQLHGSHDSLSEDFELRLVDKSCAVLFFWKSGLADALLQDMSSGAVGFGAMREMMSEGLKAAGYEAYKRVCNLGMLEADLADCLDKALSEPMDDFGIDPRRETSEIYWSSELVLKLDEL